MTFRQRQAAHNIVYKTFGSQCENKDFSSPQK